MPWVYRNPLIQWVFPLAFNTLLCVLYYIMTQLAFNIQSAQNDEKIMYFVIFSVIMYVSKAAVKSLGILIDQGKSGTISMFFFGEMTCVIFYYTFYRSLFDNLDSIIIFGGLQFVHILHEWLMYPCRVTEWYYRRYNEIVSRAG